MTTPLVRESLQGLYRAAHDSGPHVGLLLQRGWVEHALEAKEAKTEFIRRVCEAEVDDLYRHAFRRWQDATADDVRFRQLTLALKARLFVGTASGGALETGCAISHSYGMPYIPGSSVKGVVRAHACQRFGKEGLAACKELFGSGPSRQHPSGLSGLIDFHDAWWDPDSAERPLVPEVVTSHHLEYYGTDGQSPATDFDSPVPNAQVAVQGSFLFVMRGANAWLGLAAEILTDALHKRGIGAKTRAGYGYFEATPLAAAAPTCQWVDESIKALARDNHAPHNEVLRGLRLAERWAEIEDPVLRREAREDIRRRWQEEGHRLGMEGWWDNPPGGAALRARKIYQQHLPPE